jgi:hypothetical protein
MKLRPRVDMNLERRAVQSIVLCTAISLVGAWMLVFLDVHGASLRLAYLAVVVVAFSASAALHARGRRTPLALGFAARDTLLGGLILAPALTVAILLIVGGRE